jgi:hypothetical protein
MANVQYIAVSGALKRLRSPDFNLFDAAKRRVAWDSVMAEGSEKQRREANEARDLYKFSSVPLPGEATSD